MGIYTLYMGKGIYTSTTIFLEKFESEIKEYRKKNYQNLDEWGGDVLDTMTYIVKKYINPDYEVSTLAHNVFESRRGLVFNGIIMDDDEETPSYNGILKQYFIKDISDIIGEYISTKREDAINAINDMVDVTKKDIRHENDEIKLLNTYFTYVFIGKYEDICGGMELTYYPKVPEVIYSIAGMIPLIMKHYPVLQKLRLPEIESIFEQPACIWTFSNDCECCG